MPVHRVQRAVDELDAVGAVRDTASQGASTRATAMRGPTGAVSRWRAAGAQEVLAALSRRRTPRNDTTEQLRRHHAIFGGETLPHGPHPAGLSARHHAGIAATRYRIGQLMDAERHEHLSLNTEQTFSPEAVAAALPHDRRLYARGIRVRTCGLPAADEDTAGTPVHRLALLHGEYRECLQVPVKLLVFDRRVALLPADPGDLSAGALEVDQPSLVGAMVALFEQIWSTATDPRRAGVPPIVLTPREQAVLGLLAEGQTDASVAQRLGISQRTIAYTLRSLMDRLGVQNRFQLGLVIGAAQLASPPPARTQEDT
jgi:DNA-binding CsgD family transcriptional regulator